MKIKFNDQIALGAIALGVIVLIYGLLNPNSPVNTFKNGYSEVTIIDLDKTSEPNYFILFGIAIILLSLVFLVLEYRKEYKNNEQNTTSKLTAKETEIFALLQQGQTNKEIANKLFISVSTVKTHVNNIFKKLEVSKREELISDFSED